MNNPSSKVGKLVREFFAAAVVKVNNDTVNTVNVSPVIGEPDNEVVYLEWPDDKSQWFDVKLTEKGLEEAEIDEDGTISCDDSEGDMLEIKLFSLQQRKIQL